MFIGRYICAISYEAVFSSWKNYSVTAVTNRRALKIQINLQGRLCKASRRLVSSSPLPNLDLSTYTSARITEATFGALEYTDSKYIGSLIEWTT
jgi:hypothetical protein